MYYQLRPNIAIAQTAGYGRSAEDDRLRWHPTAGGLATLHGEGKVSVIPAIGYVNNDESHFTSRHYWEVGAPDATLRTGWLGRYLDSVGTLDNPMQGLSLDTAAPAGARDDEDAGCDAAGRRPVHLRPAGAAGAPARAVDAPGGGEHRRGARDLARPGLAAAGSIALESHHLYSRARDVQVRVQRARSTYPATTDPFPHRLAGLAAMVAAGLPLRVVTITSPGPLRHPRRRRRRPCRAAFSSTSDSLLAFQRDLEARGVADRVMVYVWSEFGRRAAENASAGTDHGSAGIGFLIGTKVNGQQIGSFPGVTGGPRTTSGNLAPTADFRAVYSSILEQWLDADANAILPNVSGYQRPSLLR